MIATLLQATAISPEKWSVVEMFNPTIVSIAPINVSQICVVEFVFITLVAARIRFVVIWHSVPIGLKQVS